MVVRKVFSVGALVATLISLQSTAYAFEKTPTSPNEADSVGWDEAVENSLILSNPFSDTSDLQPTPHRYFSASITPDATLPANGSRWQPGQDYHDTGTLGVAETGYRSAGKDQFGLGSWQYTAHPDAFTPPDTKPQQGVYFTAQRTFYNTDDRTVVGFATAGHVPGDVDPGSNWGTGFIMKGFVNDRPDGQFRFAVTGTTSNAGSAFSESGGTHRTETRFELTYQDKISENITFQPGINYTVNPGNNPDVPSGLVAGMRLHIQFK